MDRLSATECIKSLGSIRFTECIDGEFTIGHIDHNGRHIEVQYLEDNLGKYIALVFTSEKKSNISEVLRKLSRWIVNGRYEVMEDRLVLRSIFPILDEHFLGCQMRHALMEIWDMSNIARNTPAGCKASLATNTQFQG